MKKYSKELVKLQKQHPDVHVKFKQLAIKVGASPIPEITTIPELTERIHQALQTATMIDMCRTASKNCWIALVSALVALISAAAAWTAVYMGILEKLAKSPF